MSLLETYREKNTNPSWLADHASLAKGSSGRMFEYINTNFRTQGTFTSDFLKFLEVENLARDQWPRQGNHGQEVHKQHVTNLIQSKLFKKDANELFSRTSKGLLYTDFINLELPEADKWFINYLFLLNGYYLNRKNYIIYRVQEDLLGYFLSTEGITKDMLIKEAKKLLQTNSLSEVLRNPFFYFHSFYNDSDFLTAYLRASENEKEELAVYIEENLASENFQCCISKKYQPSGNFNRAMLMDETMVFLLTLLFLESKKAELDAYKIFFESFDKNISPLSKETVLTYLYTNRSIFDPIFEDILELEDDKAISEDSFVESLQISRMDDADVAEEYIDETSEEGRQRIKAIYNLRKRQARILSGYTCALETMNNCRPVYFTAKTSGKNYLELHHFIPREFRNDFPHSIEVLANYVTLCPRCHRQIHLAVDRERKHLINSLFQDRTARLDLVGLKLDLSKIYEYYKID